VVAAIIAAVIGLILTKPNLTAIFGEPTPPRGAEGLQRGWEGSAALSNELFVQSRALSAQMMKGTEDVAKCCTPREVSDELEALKRIEKEATKLRGQVKAVETDLAAPHADLIRYAALIREMAQATAAAFWSTYRGPGGAGRPIAVGSSGVGPLGVHDLDRHTDEQAALAGEIRAALEPLGHRYELGPAPAITNWLSILLPGTDPTTL